MRRLRERSRSIDRNGSGTGTCRVGYEGKVISGDGPFDLPWLPDDLFVANAPSYLKARMPEVQETNDGA